VEKAHLGGTCINTGCTPTKTMVASAQVAHYTRNAARWGVHAGDMRVDLPGVVARKNRIVESFRAGQQNRVDARKSLHLRRGLARFTGPHQLRVEGELLEMNASSSTPVRARIFLVCRGWSTSIT